MIKGSNSCSKGGGQNTPLASSIVQTEPTFTLALDESVVILDVAIKLVASNSASVETLVSVVSSPLSEVNPRAHWSADEAHHLKSTAAVMLAHAIDIAHRHATHSGSAQAPMRTHRYLLGADERTERAQQLAGNCAWLELRNLRGVLMSVPIKVETEDKCLIDVLF